MALEAAHTGSQCRVLRESDPVPVRGRPIADITRQDVLQWFASLHATPEAADRSAPVLSVILKLAEVYSYRPEGFNPCTGIKRYRRHGRERFLTTDEIRRLSRVLERYRESHPLQSSIVRLLLLTGCRKVEILTLKRSEYREGKLPLRDSQDWTAHGLAVVRLPQAHRWPAVVRPMGVSVTAQELPFLR